MSFFLNQQQILERASFCGLFHAFLASARVHPGASLTVLNSPGTGKTTTANKMGKVFFDMGLLTSASVEECSTTDLVGQYVGQTGPKVQKMMEKALGKVLFIDEAYRLADSNFGTEALDELVDCLTKDKFANKLVTILAGYDKDINRLMATNPGLTSRFSETVTFRHLTPDECIKLLSDSLGKHKSDLQKKMVELDMSVLTIANDELRQRLIEAFGELAKLPSWGNGRDIKTLARTMFKTIMSTAAQPISALVLTDKMVVNAVRDMLSERLDRTLVVGSTRHAHTPGTNAESAMHPPIKPLTIQTSTDSPISDPAASKPQPPPAALPSDKAAASATSAGPTPSSETRDTGVSDEVWEQLQKDKQAAAARESAYKELEAAGSIKNALAAAYPEATGKAAELEQADAQARAADDAEQQRLETERIQRELERRRKEEELAELERQRKQEKANQQKLREMGVCCAGFRWIKQANGYRCAGGSHFVSDAQLES